MKESKVTRRPPTIRDTAKTLEGTSDPGAASGLGMAFSAEAATDTARQEIIERAEPGEARAAAPGPSGVGAEPASLPEPPALPKPFLTLNLTRQGDIITDPGNVIRIPAPAMLAQGERVTAVLYRVKPNTWIPV